MADQSPSDAAVAGGAQLTPTAAALSAHVGRHGRPISWVSVVVITVGFLAGSVGLITGPTWWLFWVGTGLAAFGGILALGTGILNDWY